MKISNLSVRSTYRRKIVGIDPGGKARDFIREKQDGIWGLVGMKVDSRRRVLWANCASTDVMPMIDQSEKENWRTAVFKYDLGTGRLIDKYVLEGQGFFNDLTIAAVTSLYFLKCSDCR